MDAKFAERVGIRHGVAGAAGVEVIRSVAREREAKTVGDASHGGSHIEWSPFHPTNRSIRLELREAARDDEERRRYLVGERVRAQSEGRSWSREGHSRSVR